MTERLEPLGAAVGMATPPERVGHVLDVLMKLARSAPAAFEPDSISCERRGYVGPVVEVRLAGGPQGVVAWAKALGFGSPTNRVSVELGQAIIETVGTIFGWSVVVRHIHTEPSGRASVRRSARVVRP